jgi:hypothetical protein
VVCAQVCWVCGGSGAGGSTGGSGLHSPYEAVVTSSHDGAKQKFVRLCRSVRAESAQEWCEKMDDLPTPEAQLLLKLQQQNTVLKKAVVQEQKRSAVAEEALSAARDENAILVARIEELSALLASLTTNRHHAESPSGATGKGKNKSEGSGWLRKNLGWMGGAEGSVGSNGDGKHSKEHFATLQEELSAKAEENERLHMCLFEKSRELESVNEDLQETRRELNHARSQSLELLRSQFAGAQQQFWVQSESAIANLERSALGTLAALEAVKMASPPGQDFTIASRFSLRTMTAPQELHSGTPASTKHAGDRGHSQQASREAPWWTTGAIAEHLGGVLEAALPLLRQLMTAYTVHHAALGQRLQRLDLLDGARAPSPSHSRAARELMGAAGQHHTCMRELHAVAASLRAALCPHRASLLSQHPSSLAATPIKNAIEPLNGPAVPSTAAAAAAASPAAARARAHESQVGDLAWRAHGAVRRVAQMYGEMKECWAQLLREEASWAGRVSDAHTFGPVSSVESRFVLFALA